MANVDKLLGNSSLIFLPTDFHVVKKMAIATYNMIFRLLHNTAIGLDTQDRKMTNSQRQEQEGAYIL